MRARAAPCMMRYCLYIPPGRGRLCRCFAALKLYRFTAAVILTKEFSIVFNGLVKSSKPRQNPLTAPADGIILQPSKARAASAGLSVQGCCQHSAPRKRMVFRKSGAHNAVGNRGLFSGLMRFFFFSCFIRPASAPGKGKAPERFAVFFALFRPKLTNS